MSIKHKLWFGFGLIIALFSGLGLYQCRQMEVLGARALIIFEQPLAAIDNSRAAWDTFRDSRELVNRQLRRIQFDDLAAVEKQLSNYQSRFSEQLDAVELAANAMMIEADFDRIRDSGTRWYSLNSQRVGSASSTSVPDERVLSNLDQQLGGSLDDLVQQSLQAAAIHKEETLRLVASTQRIAIAVQVFSVALGIGLAILIALSLTRPLTALYCAVRGLSRGDGDLTKRLNMQRNDEIGHLANEMDEFIEKIYQLVAGTVTAAQSAQTTLAGVSELTRSTHNGVASQKLRLVETTIAMEQVKDAAQEVKTYSCNANERAQAIREETQSSLTLVEQAAGGIGKLAREVDSASENIIKLADDSDSISALITVIDEIAEQTNLLALNAAIEAARAGEAGRGFAVVAQEVRELAKKTSESTENIQNTIERIQGRVNHARDVMQSGSELAVECVEQSDAVSQSLKHVDESIASIALMSTDIANQTEQQTIRIGQVHGHLGEVSSIADETSDTADALENDRAKLQQALDLVGERMAQFRLHAG